MRALLLLCLTISLTGCATERIVEVPVPVEIIRTEYIPVPGDLLTPLPKATIPNGLTYGQALERWYSDRATIDKLNALLLGIKSLNEQGTD